MVVQVTNQFVCLVGPINMLFFYSYYSFLEVDNKNYYSHLKNYVDKETFGCSVFC